MANTLFKNPEIRRNIWLDFSLQRIVAMPIVIGLILLIAYWNGQDSTNYNPETLSYEKVDKGFDFMFFVAIALFEAIVIAWGSKNASDSILDEHNNRTWDWQRSHNLNPWEMTIGKLFGSTLYNWYGGVICLLVMVFTWPFLTSNQSELAFKLLSLVITGIGCHAVSIILALLAIRKSDGRGRVKSGLYILVVFYGILSVVSPYFYGLQNSFLESPGPVSTLSWYGLETSLNQYQFISMTIFSIWAVYGLFRNFRTEYQYLNGSFAWLGFLTYIVVNQLGTHFDFGLEGEKFQFSSSTQILISCLYLIYFVGLLSYAVILLEPKNFIVWKKFIEGVKQRNWKQMNYHAPLWFITYLVFWGVVLATMVFWMISDFAEIGHISMFAQALKEFGLSSHSIPLLFLSLPLFMARDFSILLYLHAAPRHKRALGATILYLAILYVLFPILLYNAEAKNVIFLFLPFGENAELSWLSALVQAGFFLYILSSKFKLRIEAESE
jgi:hypothetical protein